MSVIAYYRGYSLRRAYPKMRSGMDILVGSARMRRNVYNRLIDLTGAYSSMGEFMIDHSQTGRHDHYMVKPYLVLRDCHRVAVTGIMRRT